MPKILLADDDQELCDRIQSWLQTHDRFVVEVVHNGRDAQTMLSMHEFDAIILDWNMPGQKTGVEVCRDFRERKGETPVLMLTGMSQIEAKEEGFEAGIDDYLTKPFNLRELSVRIRALMRRPVTYHGAVLKAKHLELDAEKRLVTKEGRAIQLQPGEYDLLEFFMRNTNRVFKPEIIIERVWSLDSEATVAGLRTCIGTLRKKIDLEGQPSLIRTLFGQGYILETPAE